MEFARIGRSLSGSLRRAGGAIAAGLALGSAAAAPFAYVPNEGSASISVIDTATDRVTATFPTGAKPRGVAVSGDGRRLFVSEQAAGAVVAYDTSNGRELGRAAVGASPEALYLSPDGRRLAVAVEEDDTVAIVDTASLAVVRRIRTRGKNPEHAAWSPDGRWIYASAEEADAVDIIDAERGEVVKSVTVGRRPRGVGFLPDGSRAYVAA
jgi:YVTN family beta-propeller protein